MNPSLDTQVDLLMQGTEYGDDSLRQAMAGELRQRLVDAEAEGRRLRVYCGFDPRTSDLHLGHTIPMRKMRQFQDLGHEVIFVVGRFTSLIGDPSDKDVLRAQLDAEQARANAETYAVQAFKILDPARTRIEYNDTWLSKLTFRDLIHMASLFTVQQFLTRDNFRQRWENDDPIYLHETFYSLMQGYDAYPPAGGCPDRRHGPAVQHRHGRPQADGSLGSPAQHRRHHGDPSRDGRRRAHEQVGRESHSSQLHA